MNMDLNAKLTREGFNKGMEKLVVEYEGKGFQMTKQRAEQWFGFMQHHSEYDFNKAINEVLRNISYCPAMADIFNYMPKETQSDHYRKVD